MSLNKYWSKLNGIVINIRLNFYTILSVAVYTTQLIAPPAVSHMAWEWPRILLIRLQSFLTRWSHFVHWSTQSVWQCLRVAHWDGSPSPCLHLTRSKSGRSVNPRRKTQIPRASSKSSPKSLRVAKRNRIVLYLKRSALIYETISSTRNIDHIDPLRPAYW